MTKIPVYKGLMENKTAFGVPISVYTYLLGFGFILYILLKTFLIIIPLIILFISLKMVSRKDAKFLSIFFINIFYSKFYGF
ncbi:VirB3 family type IV secretion system protein [Streptobacillus moniliformis]|uniref:Type IV secretory pathway VirB3 family protein n=1 Tax=Streptobacillus moniliformis (strain ATCC 14647 / DSM 12112 / NCTC 10651 / 9901) TaxID=519441 RepID=D1AYH6_STRM9|nr:VirB3 family type IV secretion system protein [Streptobacillus moniliformis]ACZ01352.1 hypothetical protein Smon_0885 [Streptobacillus moniliformis DSM 12112]AVL43631.1 hypothetical protein CEP89_07420 [Streptobacillus moniliformis]SQA13489.1 Type IV secretory pathway, VirB3-like protein [Streptobacillus moniliformis]